MTHAHAIQYEGKRILSDIIISIKKTISLSFFLIQINVTISQEAVLYK